MWSVSFRMRASRIETQRGPGRLAALIGMVLLGTAPAMAQLGAPVPLLPQPRPAAPPGAAKPGAPAPAARNRAIDQDAITAAPLAPADAAWTGTLGADQGAFPRDMWQGTARGFVAAALPLLAPSGAPILQDLSRRLLLSDAVSPAGPELPGRPPLATVRLERLLALGQPAGAIAMMDALPADPSGDTLDRTRIELRFAAGDVTGACDAIESLIARYQAAWWERALIACQALAGDGAKAGLGQSLLREQKAPADPVFDALIDALAGKPRKVDRLPDPSPLRLTLLAAAKLPLPNDALAAAGPAALLAYAQNAAVPPDRRLAAAERAALLGALPPERLGELYRQIDAKPEEQTAALKDGKLPEDPRSRAVLCNVARSSAPAETRAAAIAALLTEAKKRTALPLAARLLGDAIAELRPDTATPAFAGDAARALLLLGRADAARPWLEAAQSKELSVLSSLVVPPAGDTDSAALLRDAVTELVERNSAAAPDQADLLLALVAAFDQPVGMQDWAVLLAPAHDAKLPSAAVWVAQQQATAGKRIGETVLTTVLLARSGEFLSLEPLLLGRAIAGLRAIGRDDDARALAFEAAVDAGL